MGNSREEIKSSELLIEMKNLVPDDTRGRQVKTAGDQTQFIS